MDFFTVMCFRETKSKSKAKNWNIASKEVLKKNIFSYTVTWTIYCGGFN